MSSSDSPDNDRKVNFSSRTLLIKGTMEPSCWMAQRRKVFKSALGTLLSSLELGKLLSHLRFFYPQNDKSVKEHPDLLAPIQQAGREWKRGN